MGLRVDETISHQNLERDNNDNQLVKCLKTILPIVKAVSEPL